jgi:hypothetical protein
LEEGNSPLRPFDFALACGSVEGSTTRGLLARLKPCPFEVVGVVVWIFGDSELLVLADGFVSIGLRKFIQKLAALYCSLTWVNVYLKLRALLD